MQHSRGPRYEKSSLTNSIWLPWLKTPPRTLGSKNKPIRHLLQKSLSIPEGAPVLISTRLKFPLKVIYSHFITHSQKPLRDSSIGTGPQRHVSNTLGSKNKPLRHLLQKSLSIPEGAPVLISTRGGSGGCTAFWAASRGRGDAACP